MRASLGLPGRRQCRAETGCSVCLLLRWESWPDRLWPFQSGLHAVASPTRLDGRHTDSVLGAPSGSRRGVEASHEQTSDRG
jgi:hypothetical protein